MKHARSIVFLGLGLLLGAACGWFGNDALDVERGGERGTVHGAPTPRVNSSDNAPSPDVIATAGLRSPVQSSSASQAVEIELPRATIARLAQAADPVAAASSSGTETLVGRAVDDLGQPLANVLIVAYAQVRDALVGQDPSDRGAEPSDDGLEAQLEAYARKLAVKRSKRFQTRTGQDGAFRLDGLPHATLQVSAHSDSWEFDVLRGVHPPYAAQELEGHPIQQVQVSIRRADGSEPEAATLAVQGSDEDHYRWSPDKAFLRLPPGAYDVVAEERYSSNGSAHGSRLVAKSDVQTLDLRRGEDVPSLEFVLAKQTTLSVEVESAKIAARRGRYAVLMRVAEGAVVDEAALSTSKLSARLSDGATQFVDLEPGRYAVGLRASHSNYAPSPLQGVTTTELAEGANHVRLETVAAEEDHLLAIRVIGPDGSPAPGVTFNYRRKDSSGLTSSSARPVSFRDGVYSLRKADLYDDDAPEAVTLTLTVESRRHGRIEQVLEPGATETVISYAAAASVEVALTGGIDAPRLWTIKLETAGGSQWWNAGEKPVDGLVRFENVQPGSYILIANPTGDDFRFNGVGMASKQVEVAAGENRFSLELPYLHDLTVVLPAGNPTASASLVSLASGGGQLPLRASGVDGRAVILGVKAGEHLLYLSGLEGVQQVTVPPNEVVFAGSPARRLYVTNVESPSPWLDAGLRVGDYVVGVDGVRFESEPSVGMLYQTEGSILVERGRGEITLLAPMVQSEGKIEARGLSAYPVP